MGCNCNKGIKAWLFVAPDGTETQRRTEVEARAAQIRTAKAAGATDTSNYGEIVPLKG